MPKEKGDGIFKMSRITSELQWSNETRQGGLKPGSSTRWVGSVNICNVVNDDY